MYHVHFERTQKELHWRYPQAVVVGLELVNKLYYK